MYACICEAVTDAKVRDAIEAGARTLKDIADATRAGTSCGSCEDHLCDLIHRLTEPDESATAPC